MKASLSRLLVLSFDWDRLTSDWRKWGWRWIGQSQSTNSQKMLSWRALAIHFTLSSFVRSLCCKSHLVKIFKNIITMMRASSWGIKILCKNCALCNSKEGNKWEHPDYIWNSINCLSSALLNLPTIWWKPGSFRRLSSYIAVDKLLPGSGNQSLQNWQRLFPHGDNTSPVIRKRFAVNIPSDHHLQPNNLNIADHSMSERAIIVSECMDRIACETHLSLFIRAPIFCSKQMF